MRKLSILHKLLIIFCLLLIHFPISAEEEAYRVVDNASGLDESFDSYENAIRFYQNSVQSCDNLLLYENGKLIKMEYGVVEFDADDYFEYYSSSRDCDDYLAPNYGVDGAYLYTSDDNETVYFKVANDIGYTDLNNVTLIAYENLLVKPSIYSTDDTYFYHNVKSQLNNEVCTSLKIDFIPEFLESNHDYFSYDGHYFYDDFYLMIDDYKNDSFDNAINSESYYNYYQYLSYRSFSNYSYQDLENYFYNTLGIDGKLVNYNDFNKDGSADQINRSQFYGEIDCFFTCQNLYGTNALMLISAAINDSNYGRSYQSFYNNSLFNEYAFDSSTETSNYRYNDIASSIYSYAKYYVCNRFTNYSREDFCGGFVGDKYSGITSAYALDHYYGERLASTYFTIDEKLGLKDYKKQSIAFIENQIRLYNDCDLSDYQKTLYGNQISLVILSEFEDSYLVQLDCNNSSNYYYNYEDNVAYISKDSVDYIIDGSESEDIEYVDVTYDFNGGKFNKESSLVVHTLKGSLPAYIEPSLEGYEFIGYDCELENVFEDTTYTANYKKISDISIGHLFENQKELSPVLDLSDAYINVKYEDGSSRKINITSEMLSKIDIDDTDSQEVVVTYCGLTDSKNIVIGDEFNNAYKMISEAMESGDYSYVKENVGGTTYPLTMSQIKEMDSSLRDTDNRNYVIKDSVNGNRISVSGLDLSLSDETSFSFFKDTYYMLVNNINVANKEKIETVANGYDFSSVLGMNISFKFNFQNMNLNGPIVIQAAIDDKQDDCIYTVYHVDSNGDVVKCRTTYTNNYVQFIAQESGDYLILSKPSFNKVSFEDEVENLNSENMGYDNHRFNLNVLCIMVLLILCLIGIIVYCIIRNKNNSVWKDYKKLLLRADIVQEEKPRI